MHRFGKPLSLRSFSPGTFILIGKSTKTVATRAALFGSNMHQIVCRLGLRPRPHWGSLQRPRDPLAVFRGPTSKGEGQGKGGHERRGERKGREGRGGEGRELVLCPRKKKSRRLCGLDTS